jgi:hypothetical protein
MSDDAFGPVTTTETEESSRYELRRVDPSVQANPYLDGGWWPRSLDLATELPALLIALSHAGFETYRVVYRLHAWSEAQRRITIGGRRITLSGYRKQADDTIAFIDGSGRKRLEMLVIPPDTGSDIAQRALDIAGLDGDADSADAVLERARAA